MQIKELKHVVQGRPDTEIRVVGHAGSRFYRVQVCIGEMVEVLKGWRGQIRVFRSFDEAANELRHHGIDRMPSMHEERCALVGA